MREKKKYKTMMFVGCFTTWDVFHLIYSRNDFITLWIDSLVRFVKKKLSVFSYSNRVELKNEKGATDMRQ